jgi:nucleoside phosphorylase
MQDDFGLRSEPKIYDYEWLRTCFDQVRQSLILDASAETILFLRKQHGFIRFVDAYAGLCANCATITDLRFHMDRFARTGHFRWGRFSEFWQKNIPTGEYNLGEERAVELADALGGVAARIEMSFSLSIRASTNQKVPSADRAVAHVRTAMGTDNPELMIFVALEEEFQILQGRWNLRRAFVDFAARGAINEFAIDVVCARDMGRVPAAVATGLYLAKRENDPPRLVLIVGLAGGFHDGTEEGMIIVPNTVVDLATRKIGDKGDQTTTQFRRRDFSLDQSVYEYMTSFEFDENQWQQRAIRDGDWPPHRRPSFRPGLITSLDEVVSSAAWQKTLLDDSPKLLGVEMEAGGVCAVAERYKVPVTMIRAISDKADPAKVDTQWRLRGMKTIATLIEAIEWSAIIQKLKAK